MARRMQKRGYCEGNGVVADNGMPLRAPGLAGGVRSGMEGLVLVAGAESQRDVACLGEIAACCMNPLSAAISGEAYLLTYRPFDVLRNRA